MDAQLSQANQQQILQFLTTEHFTLQTGRSTTTSETNGRSSIFLNAVSGAVVALAFIGQISGMGEAFFVFGFVLFPSVLFLGVATFVRVLQCGIEDMIYARGINRIRHFYLEIAPQMKDYFILPTSDDIASSSLRTLGLIPAGWQLFMTAAGVIEVINSMIVGVFAGMALNRLLGLSAPVCAAAGVAVFLLSLLVHQRYQSRSWDKVERHLTVLFPSA